LKGEIHWLQEEKAAQVHADTVWAGMAAKVLVEHDGWGINRFQALDAANLGDDDRAALAGVPEGRWPVSSAFHAVADDRDNLGPTVRN